MLKQIRSSSRRFSNRRLTFKDDPNTQKEKREWLLSRQREFLSREDALEELRHWKRGEDVEGGFKVLGSNGIIPKGLVGKTTNGASIPWHPADTFFSEFGQHNPQEMILSTSKPDNPDEGSLIISNHSTHDERQYPQWLDPKFAPKPDGSKVTPEGQAFGHILVIPKRRIFNVVDPDAYEDNCAIIRELKDHFTTFWSDPSNRTKLLDRMSEIFNAQNYTILKSPRNDAISEEGKQKLVKEVEADYNALAQEFVDLGPADFVYGLHPWDTNSVGHLHLHIFPRDGRFRRHSAVRHDQKTVTWNDVLAAEAEERRGKEREEKKLRRRETGGGGGGSGEEKLKGIEQGEAR